MYIYSWEKNFDKSFTKASTIIIALYGKNHILIQRKLSLEQKFKDEANTLLNTEYEKMFKYNFIDFSKPAFLVKPTDPK